jgi:hypothetical protein
MTKGARTIVFYHARNMIVRTDTITIRAVSLVREGMT